MSEEINMEKKPEDGKTESLGENLSENISPPETIEQTETENMEVHHHPHVEKKSLKEYLLEGLMIFLAVTMGFFAEGLREHIGDRSKEKEYMSLLIEELKYDTAQYNNAIKKVDLLMPQLDSAYQNIINAYNYDYLLQSKWNYGISIISVEYRPVLPTIQQLESSGNLRLIESKLLLNKIMEYEAYIKGDLQMDNNNIHAALTRVWALEDAYCDEESFVHKAVKGESVDENGVSYSMYNIKILLRDTLKLNEFANSFVNYKLTAISYEIVVNTSKRLAVNLIEKIDEEYHFEK